MSANPAGLKSRSPSELRPLDPISSSLSADFPNIVYGHPLGHVSVFQGSGDARAGVAG